MNLLNDSHQNVGVDIWAQLVKDLDDEVAQEQSSRFIGLWLEHLLA